jgi:hypothetical protein
MKFQVKGLENKQKLKLLDGWELFDTKEKEWKGEQYFHNRYVHKESKSGIVYFSTENEGKKLFIVEGYGIGTINPKTFKETVDFAPIQRHELENEEDADKALVDLMKKNTDCWKYRRD